jgi:FkbM family methyltransferase
MVLSFEPAGVPFSDLQANIRLNAASNVKAYRAALSDHAGSEPLYESAAGLVGSHLAFGSDGDGEGAHEYVPVTTIDDVLAAEGLERVDVLKLDVEGAEELALRGAAALFSRTKPLVLFEAWVGAGEARDGAWRLLSSLGYAFYSVAPGGELRPQASPRHGNNIALPPGATP